MVDDPARAARDRLEGLLELADRAELEVRILSAASRGGPGGGSGGLAGSAACRVKDRIWVVLSPDDPAAHQAHVLAEALSRYRGAFLEAHFVAPALRDYIESVDPQKR